MKNGIGKTVIGATLVLLLCWPGNVAAEYKKKVSIEPLQNPAGWDKPFDPGAIIAKMLERSVRSLGRYQLIPVSPAFQSADAGDEIVEIQNLPVVEIQKPPAQVLVQGRVLTFKPVSPSDFARNVKSPQGSINKKQAEVEIELIFRDGFTRKILAKKRFRNRAIQGKIPFHAPAVPLDLNAPVFRTSAMGRALKILVRKSQPFIEETLARVPFESLIISVDEEKEEVVVNAGKNHGIVKFERFYVYSVDLNFIDPVTRQNLGEKVALQGVIKVKAVLENYFLAEIVAGGDFKEGFVARPPKSGPPKEKSWQEFYGKLF